MVDGTVFHIHIIRRFSVFLKPSFGHKSENNRIFPQLRNVKKKKKKKKKKKILRPLLFMRKNDPYQNDT